MIDHDDDLATQLQDAKDEIRRNWPRSLREAVRMLYARMSDEDIEYMQGLTEENAIEFHHNLGRQIRNNFGLWKCNDALLKDLGMADKDVAEAADGGSQVVIKHLIGYVLDLHGPKVSKADIDQHSESAKWLCKYLKWAERDRFVNSAHAALVLAGELDRVVNILGRITDITIEYYDGAA